MLARVLAMALCLCLCLCDLQKFLTGKFLGEFAVRWLLKISPLLAYVATLPCENISVRKQTINDKLQSIILMYSWIFKVWWSCQ